MAGRGGGGEVRGALLAERLHWALWDVGRGAAPQRGAEPGLGGNREEVGGGGGGTENQPGERMMLRPLVPFLRSRQVTPGPAEESPPVGPRAPAVKANTSR